MVEKGKTEIEISLIQDDIEALGHREKVVMEFKKYRVTLIPPED